MVVKQYENRGRVLEDLQFYDLAAKKEKPVALNGGTGTNALTPTSATGLRYKVIDLINNSKENDKKLLGISGIKTTFSKETDVKGKNFKKWFGDWEKNPNKHTHESWDVSF